MRRIALLLAVMLAGAVAPASGQARVEATVDSAQRDPKVRIHNLMETERWREALDDAFRISLHWRIELWKRGTFWSTNEKSFEFRVVIRREPLLGQYFITYFIPRRDPIIQAFTTLDDFVMQLERAIPIRGMAPRTEGDWYYVASLELSALDEEQFADMQRFLDGSGDGSNGGGVISNFLLRSVGLPSQTLPAARTPSFRVP